MIDYLAELEGTDLLVEAIRGAERILPRRGEAVRREDEVLPAAAEGPWRAEMEEMVRLPLLEAVEAAERRVVQGIMTAEQGRRGRGDAEPREEMARRENQRKERGGEMNPGELLTLRQVDRAFQRDGRRYDSGFFLY